MEKWMVIAATSHLNRRQPRPKGCKAQLVRSSQCAVCRTTERRASESPFSSQRPGAQSGSGAGHGIIKVDRIPILTINQKNHVN